MDPWATDAQAIGASRSIDFLVVVEQALRTAVHRALDELEFANP